MPHDKREPQSYGSNADWVTGRTGQQVNEPAAPAPEHREFYDERRESETSAPDQGGKTSPVQRAESPEAPSAGQREDATSTGKVSVQTGGTKTEGYFRKRDYEGE